jgi:hypothetical protein
MDHAYEHQRTSTPDTIRRMRAARTISPHAIDVVVCVRDLYSCKQCLYLEQLTFNASNITKSRFYVC